MNRLIAILQLLCAVVLFLFALLSLINILFIAPREETISVVNAMIGLGVLVVCLTAIGTVLFKKGMRKWRDPEAAGISSRGASDSSDDSRQGH